MVRSLSPFLALSLALSAGGALAQARDCSYGPDTCIQGYVWRDAAPNDVVCVTPQVRAAAKADNAQAAARRNPAGAYGPNTCIQGYVWREAFPGDVVCVTPATREQAAADNRAAAQRRACR